MRWFCKLRSLNQNTWQYVLILTKTERNPFFIFQSTVQFRKKQKHLLGKMFGSPDTSNQIYLP